MNYIDKLREAGEKATAGPWVDFYTEIHDNGYGYGQHTRLYHQATCEEVTRSDKLLMELARECWPALVEVVAAAGKVQELTHDFEDGEGNPAPFKRLTAALARLRASVGEGGG